MDPNNHVETLLPGYVLGCLDEAEMAQVAKHLDDCPACQIELEQYQAVSDRLALALPEREPPVALESRLMARIRPQQRPSPQPQLSWRQQLVAWMQRSAPAWGLASLALILILSVTVLTLWQRVNQLEQPAYTSGRYAIDLVGVENAREATGFIIVDESNQQNFLVVNGLPALTETQQYQLWLIEDGQRTSGAIFSVSQEGYGWVQVSSPIPLSNYSNFGVTIEPAGGSPGPTGAKVLGTTF